MRKIGRVVSINVSERKTVRKKPVGKVEVRENHGIVGDAHAGDWHRQVSFLALESINKMVEKGLKVGPGDFAENITTEGFNPLELPIGQKFAAGDVIFEVTQHGKECHTRCTIYYQAGDCVMPREGIFARVLSGGEIKVNDDIYLLEDGDEH